MMSLKLWWSNWSIVVGIILRLVGMVLWNGVLDTQCFNTSNLWSIFLTRNGIPVPKSHVCFLIFKDRWWDRTLKTHLICALHRVEESILLINMKLFRKKCEEERLRREQQLDFVLKESEAIKHHFKKKIESVGSHVEELGERDFNSIKFYKILLNWVNKSDLLDKSIPYKSSQ